MGSCASSPAAAQERKQVQMRAFRHVTGRLRISPAEADVLYAVYDSTDSSRDGFITVSEFFKLINLPSSVFTHRIYRLFDRNSNSEVDFGEFMVACWLFLPLTKHALLTFAFELFDLNGTKYISAQTIQEIIRELSADPSFDINLLSELDFDSLTPKNNTKGTGLDTSSAKVPKTVKLNEDHFAQFALMYPCILYPALCILDRLREKLGGTEYWETITATRMGAGGTSEYLSFIVELKRKTLRDNGLGQAFTLIRNGTIAPQNTASRKSVQQLKDHNNQRFGINSSNSSFRTISLLRQASSLILNNLGRRKGTTISNDNDGQKKNKRKTFKTNENSRKHNRNSSSVLPERGGGRR